MKRKAAFVIAVVILLAGMGWYAFGSRVDSQDSSAAMPNRPAAGPLVGNSLPAFTLPDSMGREQKIGGLGKVTVLNFWATWCPPCRAEMPELARFSENYGDKISFYAVNIQETLEKVQDFLQQNKIIMPVLLDRQGEAARLFRISAIPTTIVADKQGIIRFRKSGTVTESELAGIIKGL